MCWPANYWSASPRRHFPCIHFNCAALPKDLLEAELFGYRLNDIPVNIVPLRERREDVIPMAYHFIEKTVKGPSGKGIRIHPTAEKALQK